MPKFKLRAGYHEGTVVVDGKKLPKTWGPGHKDTGPVIDAEGFDAEFMSNNPDKFEPLLGDGASMHAMSENSALKAENQRLKDQIASLVRESHTEAETDDEDTP